MNSGDQIKTSTCGICHPQLSCGLRVKVENGIIKEVAGDPRTPSSQGTLCPRGWATAQHVHNPERLLYPMKRRGERGEGKWERISWDDALDEIATQFQRVRDQYGPESVIFYIGLPKEVRPFYQRLAYSFGSPNYITESSTCFSATVIAGQLTYGYWGLPDVANANGMMSWASNPFHSNPAHMVGIKKRINKGGLKLIVVDPRTTPIAEMADIHLRPRPGSDGALALGMINYIVKENLHDREFMEKWTVGFDELRSLAEAYTPERVAEITGVPAEDMIAAARMFATTKPACLRSSTSATVHHTNGIPNHRAIILLSALTGNFDVPGGNVVTPYGWLQIPSRIPTKNITLYEEKMSSLKPRVGQKEFPVFCRLYDEGQGMALPQQIETGQPYPLKAMIGIGANYMMWPNSERCARALKALDFLVVSDFFPTPTTAFADIVLPAATSLERDGMIQYPGGYAMWRKPAIEPVGESWPDWKLVFELAKRLGVGDLFWDGSLEKGIDEVMSLTGITAADLKAVDGPYKVDLPPVKYKKYEEQGFPTPSGKVEIKSSILEEHGFDALPVYREPQESPVSTPELATKYPLVLTTGARKLEYMHSQLRNVPALRERAPHPEVDINPADAAARGVQHGDDVLLSSPRGAIIVKANVSEIVPAGVLNMLHGWAEADVNILIDDKTCDPVSGFPAFKSFLAQVSKAH